MGGSPLPSAQYLGVAVGVALFAASPLLVGVDRLHSAADLQRHGDTLPRDAHASLGTVLDTVGQSRFTLQVEGLRPRTEYGAHLHVAPCGATGSHAGPRYQHMPNPHPRRLPHDPAYVNRANEVWLDLSTDARGQATSTAEQPWQFRPGTGPRSVIIHEEHTRTSPQEAGHAGARIGCLDVRL